MVSSTRIAGRKQSSGQLTDCVRHSRAVVPTVPTCSPVNWLPIMGMPMKISSLLGQSKVIRGHCLLYGCSNGCSWCIKASWQLHHKSSQVSETARDNSNRSSRGLRCAVSPLARGIRNTKGLFGYKDQSSLPLHEHTP